MNLSRRELLGQGLASLALGSSGCDVARDIARAFDKSDLPERFETATTETVDDDVHFLSRVTMGPRPGDLEVVRSMGRAAYLREQLSTSLDPGMRWRLRADNADVMHMPPDLLFELAPEPIEHQLTLHAVASAVFSERQLHEVMVETLSDHFHIALAKSDCRHLLPADRRDVVRAHALGNFRDLLRASILSPAMLVYLDGRENSVEAVSSAAGGAVGGVAPNENHARELLELHTLGVHGGYTQADVKETARCLTGWVVDRQWRPGSVEFVPARHDDGEKVVLGKVIAAGGGAADIDRLLDLLMDHPSTATHVATRLAKTFVSEDPPSSLVRDAAATFQSSRGELSETVRAIVESDAFMGSKRTKVKRPFRWIVSTLRALGVTGPIEPATIDYLTRMGHRPYGWPTPDGYPSSGLAYVASLMARFQYVNALVHGGLKRTPVPAKELARAVRGDETSGLLAHLFGRRPSPHELAVVSETRTKPEDVLALGLSSPAFQRF